MPHEVGTQRFDQGIRRLPDAIVSGLSQNHHFKLALEVELTQKSRSRVKNKIEDYISNRVFDYILYVFNDFMQSEGGERAREANVRFILGYKEKILSSGIRLEKLDVCYKKQMTTFEQIFGERVRKC